MTVRSRPTAILVQAQVRVVEIAINVVLHRTGSPTRVPLTGVVGSTVLSAFREALLAVGLGEDEIGSLEEQGPRGLAVYLPNGKDQLGLSEDAARAFEAAWAWWAIKQGPPIPRQAYHVLADFNRQLEGSGMAPLTPDVVTLFADVPAAPSSGGVSGKILLAIGSAIALTLGVVLVGRRRERTYR